MVKLKQNDWKILFPTETFTLGETVLEIKPLNLENIPQAVRDMRNILSDIEEKGITFDNYTDNFEALVTSLVTKTPGLISLMAGLDIEDVKRLPLSISVALALKCVEVNLSSQEDFLKNLTALMEKTATMVGTATAILES